MAKHPASAAKFAPSLMAADTEILDLEIKTFAIDTRPVTPAEIQTHPNLLSLADLTAERLADQVSERVREFLNDRDFYRQEYVVKLPGWGDTALVLPRFPIEVPIADADGFQVPEVSLLRGSALSLGTDQAIEADSYRIRGNCHNELYRDRGWEWTTQVSSGVRPDPLPGLETSDYTIGNGDGLGAAGSLSAGYLMPGQVGSNQEGPRKDTPAAAIENWQTGVTYGVSQSTAFGDAQGSFIIPSRASIQADQARGRIVLECTTAGTSGATEPAWVSTTGATFDDNGLIWTTRAARVLPRMVRQAAWIMADLIDKENRGTVCDGSQWGMIKHMLRKACI